MIVLNKHDGLEFRLDLRLLRYQHVIVIVTCFNYVQWLKQMPTYSKMGGSNLTQLGQELVQSDTAALCNTLRMHTT